MYQIFIVISAANSRYLPALLIKGPKDSLIQQLANATQYLKHKWSITKLGHFPYIILREKSHGHKQLINSKTLAPSLWFF